jgi:hypothetical protein
MSTNKNKDSECDSEQYLIEFDNSSNEHESEISLSSVVDNIFILITDIEEQSDNQSDSSSESWTEIYQNKTGIRKEELHDFITQYRDFFGNKKLDNDKRKKLIMLVKNMILISSNSPIKKK